MAGIFIKIIKKTIKHFIVFLQSIPLYREYLNKILYKDIKYRQVLTAREKKAFLNFYNPKETEVVRLEQVPKHSCIDSYSFMALFLGKIIGGATLVKADNDNNYPGWWLYSLEIYLPFRRLGIGERLIRKLLDFAQGNKIESIYLSVWEKAGPAVSLYEKIGFKKINERTIQVSETEKPRKYLLMKKDLV